MPMSVPIIAAGLLFTCTPTAVWDGDGPIWCAEGPHIRLAGIAARELDGSCRPGQPCPTESGVAARDGLVRLIGTATGTASTGHILVSAAPLRCQSEGPGKGTRTAAWCVGARGDLSCAMVRLGYALRWDRYGGREVCATRHEVP